LDVPAGGFRFNSLRRVPHPTTPDEVKDFRNGSLRVLRVLRGGASSSFNPQTATANPQSPSSSSFSSSCPSWSSWFNPNWI